MMCSAAMYQACTTKVTCSQSCANILQRNHWPSWYTKMHCAFLMFKCFLALKYQNLASFCRPISLRLWFPVMMMTMTMIVLMTIVMAMMMMMMIARREPSRLLPSSDLWDWESRCARCLGAATISSLKNLNMMMMIMMKYFENHFKHWSFFSSTCKIRTQIGWYLVGPPIQDLNLLLFFLDLASSFQNPPKP